MVRPARAPEDRATWLVLTVNDTLGGRFGLVKDGGASSVHSCTRLHPYLPSSASILRTPSLASSA
jgi:hypothetical protein